MTFCFQKGDIEAIEKVQKRATKLVISLKKLPCKERLLQLNVHTLKYRRLRGDMIEVYKITHDMYDRSVALELPRNVSSCCCFHVVQNVAIEASLYAT